MKNVCVRNSFIFRLICLAIIGSFSVTINNECLFASETAGRKKSEKKVRAEKKDLRNKKTDTDAEEASIWESKPIEITEVNVQVLDKISGKVLNKKITVGKPLKFGGIEVTLKRCFKNAPEDNKEISAFVEITERNSIFAKWLFASAPCVNLFEHPQYDVRVGF